MSIGLLALLDDVAALVKMSAASLDDIPAQVAKTSGKVSGIVIDDTAVTPKYVVGLDPAREIAVIAKIARKSLVNKIVLLGPAALLLGYFAPWSITPLLMLGGAYLCFEGYEKVHSLFATHDIEPTQNAVFDTMTADELENTRVQSAVRTDFILSAEIVAITYATVAQQNIVTQIIVMLCVAVVITVAVYGFVGLIVKADDVGVQLAKQQRSVLLQTLGRGLVTFMPACLAMLGYIGTAAMLWVGAEIIAHGIPVLHHVLQLFNERFAAWPVMGWGLKVTVCAVGGLALGAIVAIVVTSLKKLKARF